jgi:hypothetical protein
MLMRFAVAFFLILPASLAAADLVPAVPSQFIGEWNGVISDCGTDNNDSRLRIRKDHIVFHESSGPIKAVVTSGRYEIALIVELSDEGETWISINHFKLSSDGKKLTSVDLPGDGFPRYRCPSKRK